MSRRIDRFCRTFLLGSALAVLPRPALAEVRVGTVAQADAFCRQSNPTTNYGGAGALCIAGSSSVNSGGAARGRFDSMLKFETTAAKSAFDQAFGTGRWRVSAVNLLVREDDTPSNAIFPRGDGRFDLFWFSNDNWSEGSGRPNAPATGSGNQLTFSYLTAIAGGATAQSLGRFENLRSPEVVSYSLGLPTGLLGDISAGTPISIRGVAVTATLGFVFNARDYVNDDWRPRLEIVATATLPGDANCDGRLDNFDIDPFVLALTDATAFPGCGLLASDMDDDGALTNFDIDPFVTCLVDGCF